MSRAAQSQFRCAAGEQSDRDRMPVRPYGEPDTKEELRTTPGHCLPGCAKGGPASRVRDIVWRGRLGRIWRNSGNELSVPIHAEWTEHDLGGPQSAVL